MANIPVQPHTGTPTIIGNIEEKNVTFLIDTSGSMYSFLPVVKEHLLEALLTRSFKEKDTMFNIVQFNSTVSPWADQMVKCTPQTVTVAGEWLRSLECSTGTNTLDALVVAHADKICEAVYLVTDGLPDQGPETILREVAKVGQGRPIHCIYLVGASADTPAHDFLESLAVQTAGTFHLMSLSQRGDVERVTAVVKADHAGHRINNPVYTTQVPISSGLGLPTVASATLKEDHSEINRPELVQESSSGDPTKPVKYCSVRTSVDHNPMMHGESYTAPMTYMAPSKVVQYPETTWEAYRPPRVVRRLVAHSSPLAADKGLIQGMRVVAKRDRDGYYCPGTLTEEVCPQRTVLITFDRDPKGPKQQHQAQETGLYNIIAYNDAMRHTITPGDKVLTPWEKEAYRMAPGIVLEGIEGRSSGCAADTEFLIVNLFHGKTEKIPKQRAVWIPGDLYERIKLEIQMPLTARQFLDRAPHYSPAHSSFQPGLKPSYATFEAITSLGNQRDVPAFSHGRDQYVYHVQGPNQSFVTRDAINALIPGTNMTKDELHDKVMKQLSENSSPKFSDSLKFRSSLGRSQELTERKVCFEDRAESKEDSGVCLEKTELEEEVVSDSGCEEDQLMDAGVQTLSLVDAGSMTDSLLLHTPGLERRIKEKPMWHYWKQTPQPRSSKVKVGPFRETSLSAPVEAKAQPRYVEPIDYVGSLSQSTNFNDRDLVKTDNAQREWLYRQPLPPRVAYNQPPTRKEATTYQPRPSTAHPSYFNSSQEQVTPAYYVYEPVGPPNRSSAFGKVDHTMKSDRAQLEWMMKHQQPLHVQVPQGPGRPVSASVGTRDMIREAQEKAMLDRRRLDATKREARWKGKEYDALRMKEAKEERNRKFTADVIQREAHRQAMSEKQVQMTSKAKRAVSASIRNKEVSREQQGRNKEVMRMEALTQRRSKRAELQTQRNQDIEAARTRRQDMKEQQNNDRSQRHSSTLAEQRQQQMARDDQMRNAQIQRINQYHQKEAFNQERKDLRIAVHSQKLQEYRSQVLP